MPAISSLDSFIDFVLPKFSHLSKVESIFLTSKFNNNSSLSSFRFFIISFCISKSLNLEELILLIQLLKISLKINQFSLFFLKGTSFIDLKSFLISLIIFLFILSFSLM